MTRNPEIEKTPVWILSNNLWLEQVKHTKFGMDVSNDKLLNFTKR